MKTNGKKWRRGWDSSSIREKHEHRKKLLQRPASLEITPLPDISNNVGSVKRFSSRLVLFTPKEWLGLVFG